MQLKLRFETIEDIKNFSAKTQIIKLQLLQFQAATINRLGELITLNEIHRKMRAAGFDEKIIDGTVLSFVEFRGPKKVRMHFESVYFSDTGFDVAVAREKGTVDHDIKPVFKKALHGGFKWPFFSKGHEVSGIEALFIVRDTVRETEEDIQKQYKKELLDWYQKNLGGIAIGN